MPWSPRGGGQVQLYSFLTSALDSHGWSTPRPGRFTAGKDTRYPLHREMGDPRAGLGGCGKSRPTLGFDPQIVHPVVNRYTTKLSLAVGLQIMWRIPLRSLLRAFIYSAFRILATTYYTVTRIYSALYILLETIWKQSQKNRCNFSDSREGYSNEGRYSCFCIV